MNEWSVSVWQIEQGWVVTANNEKSANGEHGLQVRGGTAQAARIARSPFYNARPGAEVSLLVIHNISLPAGRFGLPYIEQLFLGQLDCGLDASFESLRGLEVSAHFLIRRNGELVQFVSCDDRAWHAGVSSFAGRTGCNDFAIGIELEGTDTTPFEDEQYNTLIELTFAIMAAYPLIRPFGEMPGIEGNKGFGDAKGAARTGTIVGHSDIAPGRKTDPGEAFDWGRYFGALEPGRCC